MLKQLFFILPTLFIAQLSYAQETRRFQVFFDTDKWSISRKTMATADSVVQLLRTNTIDKLEISGHCDSRGSNAYNDTLSQRRAVAVNAYLAMLGYNASIPVTVKAMGEQQPLNLNQSDEDKAMNRRVEITVYISANSQPAVTNPVTDQPAPVAIQPEQKPVIKKTLTEQLNEDSILVGSQLVLDNINFQPGRHYLLNQSMPVLEELLSILKKQTTLKIQIQGHVCCSFRDEDGLDADLRTMNLSEERAKTIYKYLIENGIKASRLSYKGFGGSMKLYPEEKNERERILNRRVEIKIIEK